MPTRFFRFNFSRRHFSFLARRWKLRFGAALFHWASPEFNPFFTRELRRFAGRKNGPSFIFWPLILIAIALALTAQFHATAFSALENLAASESIRHFWTIGILGANEISLMALMAAGICGYATLIYSYRAARVFQRENLSGTLNPLLLLPLPETRLALLTSAPAAASAMALWFLLLPLWMLALATNQWSWREFFGVPLLFLLFTIRPPEWTPIYEEYTSPHDTFDEQEEKEIAEDSQIEEQKIAPEFHGDDEGDEPQISDDPRYKPLFNFDPVGIITLLVIWQIVMFIARNGGFKVPPSAINYLLPHWREFLPMDVWNLLPSILFSWPIFLVQLLTTPLPFFGIALPLGLWLIPRILLDRYAAFSIFRLSYRGSHSLQFRRWGRHWRVAKKTQAHLFWFFASGFLWPWLINKGTFAAVLPGTPINDSWARAGLWTVLLIIATWTISARLHGVLNTPLKKTSALRRQKFALVRCRRAWRNAKGVLFGAAALYSMLCWLGGTSGMDAVWRSRLITTFLVMAAYLLADFSSLALKNALTERYRILWNWVRFFWFWGLFWETVFRVGGAHYSGLAFDLPDASHVLFSPLVSLMALLNSDVALSLQGAVWQLGLAILVFGAAYILTFHSPGVAALKTVSVGLDSASQEPSFFLNFSVTLWRVIWFVPSLILRLIFWPFKTLALGSFSVLRPFFENIKPFVEGKASALKHWMESFDNPILQRAFKAKWKNDAMVSDLTINWLCLVGLQVLIILVLMGRDLIKPASVLFYGGNTEYNRQAALAMLQWRSWGNVVFGVAMVFGLLTNLVTLTSQTKVFDIDRKNGGMVFLFLTPLSESEIIGGHVCAAFAPGVWYHSAIYPSVLFAFLLEIIAGHIIVLPLLFLLTILLHTLLVWSAIASVWSAVRAKKAESGSAWALLCGLVPQAILVVALLFIIFSMQFFWAMVVTAFCVVLCAFAAYLFWLEALRCLRQERFGDISIHGTVAN